MWQWKLGFGAKPHCICPSRDVTRPAPETVTSTSRVRRGDGTGGGGAGVTPTSVGASMTSAQRSSVSPVHAPAQSPVFLCRVTMVPDGKDA